MRKNTHRERLFWWILDEVLKKPEGQMLRWYEVAIRFAILPLNTLYYWLDKHNSCYNMMEDVYTIGGKWYRGQGLRLFTENKNQVVKVFGEDERGSPIIMMQTMTADDLAVEYARMKMLGV